MIANNRVVLFAVVVVLLVFSVKSGLDIESDIHQIWQRHHWTISTGEISNAPITTAATPNMIQIGLDARNTVPVPYPKDHPPKKIVVGRDLYSVVYLAHDFFASNRCLAYTNYPTHTIYLDRQRDSGDVREDVVHELLHASLHSGPGFLEWAKEVTGQDEEGWVKPVAPTFREVLRDNPELVKWLQE